MLLIDALIHEFHVNHGIDGRPVGENIIAGSRKQVCELIEGLAYGTDSTRELQTSQAWRSRLNDPIRLFRQKHSWAKTQAIARELGIKGYTRIREDQVVEAIRRVAPELFKPNTRE
jgi:hypothetical protein